MFNICQHGYAQVDGKQGHEKPVYGHVLLLHNAADYAPRMQIYGGIIIPHRNQRNDRPQEKWNEGAVDALHKKGPCAVTLLVINERAPGNHEKYRNRKIKQRFNETAGKPNLLFRVPKNIIKMQHNHCKG